MSDIEPGPTYEFDHDVVIVGGGPAGCSAGVFTARYGLDTVIFDRGRSSIQRCAYLENYLGFPAGVDIETLYGLMHDHAEEAGCEIIPDLVESIQRTYDGGGFIVKPQEGHAVTAHRVVAATRYDGEYMRGLDDDAAMFEEYEHDGETHEHFDSEYADYDGVTPVERLYVASPSVEADKQAIMAAGRGARVGRRVLEDVREERGYPGSIADHYDWLRQEAELDDEWSDRDRWREWFDERLPDDCDLDEDRHVELRERDIDRSFETYLSDEAIETCKETGHQKVAARLNIGAVVRAIDEEALLDAIDDETIHEYAAELRSEAR